VVGISHINEELTHIVHRYGRFPLNTSNSKPAVNTVSQLRLLSGRASQGMDTMNAHVDAGDSMVELDQSNCVTETVSGKVTDRASTGRTVIFQDEGGIVPVYHLGDNSPGEGADTNLSKHPV
jgi:hypothetical protein